MRRIIVVMIISTNMMFSIQCMRKKLLAIFANSQFRRTYWIERNMTPPTLSKTKERVIQQQQKKLLEDAYLSCVIYQNNGTFLVQTSKNEWFSLPNQNLQPKKKK